MNVRHVSDDAPAPARSTAAVFWRAVVVCVPRPSLWWPAVTAVRRLAPHRWWRRPPFLPVPDERYWRFRMETAYGDACASPDDEEVIEVLRWSRRLRTPRR